MNFQMNPEDPLAHLDAVPEGIGGYQRLARFMGPSPNHAMFRRFCYLSSLNLLYYQAELSTLERQLSQAAEVDRRSGNRTKQYFDISWPALSKALPQKPGPPHSQWQIMLQIRHVLREYNEAILQQERLWQLAKPHSKDLAFLQKWMTKSSMGCINLSSVDRESWDFGKDELIVLKPDYFREPLTRWISGHIESFHRLVGHHFKKPTPEEASSNTVTYSHTNILRITSVLALSLSSIVPIISIVALNAIVSTANRIAAMAGFTFLFSIALGMMTSGREVDVFAASAAFAAVQVVFIAGNNNATVTCNCA